MFPQNIFAASSEKMPQTYAKIQIILRMRKVSYELYIIRGIFRIRNL